MTDQTLFEVTTDLHAEKDLGMYYCGKRIQTEHHVYGPMMREHYLFLFVNEGTAEMYRNGVIVRTLKKHDLLLMSPHETIHYRALTPWSIQWVGLYGEAVLAYTKQLGLSAENPVTEIKSHFEMQELLERIYLFVQKKNAPYDPELLSLLYAFFALLFREKGGASDYDYVSSAKNIIQHNLDQALSVKSISDSLHLNSAYFTRLFVKEMGNTPKQYILEQKMERARSLLRETNASIEEIAASLGFSDSLYFSKIFRKKHQISPTAYRKSQKQI